MSGLRMGLQLTVVNTYGRAVWGDEVMAVGLADAFRARTEVKSCEVYGPDTIHDNLDLIISFYAWPETRLVRGPRMVWWYQAPRLNPAFGEAAVSQEHYDAVLVAGPLLGKDVISHGGERVLFVPMSANDAVYRPAAPREEYRHPIVFVANHNRTRQEVEQYLLPLLPLGLAIYGSGWEREPELGSSGALKGRIHPSDVPALYSSSDLVLSCHTGWHRDNDVPTSRLWEATCCGAPVISDRVPTAEKLFGETITFTDGGEALVAQVRQLLADPDRREAQAAAAKHRVETGLTFRHHAARILEFLGYS